MESYKYIAHHGTKGMHWGEWNAETEARYMRERGAVKKVSEGIKTSSDTLRKSTGKYVESVKKNVVKYANNAKNSYINGEVNKAVNKSVGYVVSQAKDIASKYSGVAISSLAPKALSTGSSFVGTCLSNPYVAGGVALGSLALGIVLQYRANKKRRAESNSGNAIGLPKGVNLPSNWKQMSNSEKGKFMNSVTDRTISGKSSGRYTTGSKTDQSAERQMISRAKSLRNSGKTIEEVAKALGIPESTAADYIYW